MITAIDRCGTYPFNFDASLNYTRGPGDGSLHPYPGMIGFLSGLLPQFDAKFVLPQSASSGWGPMAGVQINNEAPYFVDVQLYTLPKVEG